MGLFLHTTSCSWKIRNCSSQSFRFIAVANFLLFLIGYGPSTSKLMSCIKGAVSCFKPLCQGPEHMNRVLASHAML